MMHWTANGMRGGLSVGHLADVICKTLSQRLATELCAVQDCGALQKDTQIVIQGLLYRAGSPDHYQTIDLVSASCPWPFVISYIS